MTEEGDRLGDRVEALESRVAHQDRTIEALNEVVTAQWATIERLKREVEALGERMEEAVAGPGPVDRPPPHY
ncbi:SlyX family protein [Hansschlegelia zhihuaiae]|uniref:Protein SlyX homolog n=1 Tax=Hansschlegelia zhihuaiae TaxID=405005 RepID=A0A4Q0MPG0_9HYPH|nr:SlyX family protein [Hansschlegelia zhihuaiae]RXF75029.1 SlyX family protein [Hansschlegelia zhihuaiae]